MSTNNNSFEEEKNDEIIDGNLDNSSDENSSQTGKKKFKLNIHVILLSIIVIIFGISAYKLIAWNHGETVVYDPEEDTSEFDVEILDEILPLTADTSKHAYDDETTILLLGDGALAMSREDESGLDDKIADATGATVYNGAFPFISLSAQNLGIIEQNYPDDVYSLSYIADAICTGDFSEMDRITETYHGDGNFTRDAVKVLKSVDYDNLDVIVIMYDGRDYFMNRSVENPNDDEERCTYVGSLKRAIREIQRTYPYIRIIVSSLYYSEGINDDGSRYDADLIDAGNGTLSNYVYVQMQACSELSVTFLDNFYGTINQNNHEKYIDYSETSYIKPNEEGQQLLAKRIAYAVKTFPNDK